MEKAWLASQLEAGRSFEAIAREVGKHPSTVSYWARRHGLSSAHAERHAGRGGIAREQLEALVERGLSSRAIAAELGLSQTTVRHWLQEHGLQTQARRRVAGPAAETIERSCPRHGPGSFTRSGPDDHFRCRRCRNDRVKARRRAIKATLVAEAGGECVLCGYGRCPSALHFHHVDPSTKRFGLALRGVARSLAAARKEAAKCVLLCANCHAEVEAGVAQLPFASAAPGASRPG